MRARARLISVALTLLLASCGNDASGPSANATDGSTERDGLTIQDATTKRVLPGSSAETPRVVTG
jgi:hypothetical protein